jgi:hypothetical protein
MATLLAIWNWFNGNKTNIGLLLLALSKIVPPGVIVFGYDLQTFLVWAGGALTTVGVAHKIVKSQAAANGNGGAAK